MLSGMTGWVVGVMERAGYIGLAGLVALENVFPPIPSEIVLPMGGFLTGQGRLNFVGAVVAATVGSVVGALILYELGRRLGEDRVCRFASKHGKWLLVSEDDYHRAAAWFKRHGQKAILLGRCAPGVRSFVSIPAGVHRMPLTQFTIYTAIGSGVYNVILIGLGWLLGHNWQRVSRYTGVLEAAVWIILAGLIGYWIYRKKFRKPVHA